MREEQREEIEEEEDEEERRRRREEEKRKRKEKKREEKKEGKERERKKGEEKKEKEEREEKRKLLIPTITFNFVNRNIKLIPVSFKKKLFKKKFSLPAIKLKPISMFNVIFFPSFKKILVKKKFILPPIFFERIEKGKEIQPIKFKKFLLKRKLLLPSVNFHEMDEMKPHFLERIKYEIKEKEIAEVEVSAGTEISEAGEEIEEEKDLFTNLFGCDIEAINTREPHIIFLIEEEGKRVKELLKSILQRIIEEMEEEFKGFREESIISELRSEEKGKRQNDREKEIERYLNILEKVFIVNLEREEDIRKLDTTSLIDRLNELKGRGIGFLVFVLEPSAYRNIDIIKQKLGRLTYLPNIHILKVKDDISPYDLVSKIYGIHADAIRSSRYIKKDFMPSFSSGEDYSYLAEIARKLQLKERVRIKSLLSDIVKRNEGEKESDLHYDLKCLVVYYLLRKRFGDKITWKLIYENLDKIEKEISTEKKLKDEKIIIDVVKGRDVWEIETLFAQGLKGGVTTKKIDETIEKYCEKNEEGIIKGIKSWVNTINIVLDNLTLYLHFSEIKRKMAIWQKRLEKWRLKKETIKFWTVDWSRKELVEI